MQNGSASPLTTSIAVELKGLSKSFGAIQANQNISLSVRAGSIHGLIGENGAGKSTTAKMIYGLYHPDEGQIRIRGVEKVWRSPADAIHAGIGMVHQHFMLAGPHTALDNVLLGAEPFQENARWIPRLLRPMDRVSARARLEELSQSHSLPVDWDACVSDLSVGVQQRIEILKLLYRRAEILILDEPTAVLTPQETSELFKNLRDLRASGKTILIITHKLKEVMELTDRVTVFRQGRVSGEIETQDASPEKLAEMMVGRKVQLQISAEQKKPPGEEIFRSEKLSWTDPESGKKRLNEVSLKVRSGEIVGIAGVEGNGQTELLHSILRPLPQIQSGHLTGELWVSGQNILNCETREIREKGVGFVPEDRHHEGLLMEAPLTENFLLGRQRSSQFNQRGLLKLKEIEQATQTAIREFDVRPADSQAIVQGLSGGNQQKLIIARELGPKPKFLIAAQPTRGVDIGAIELIHQQIVHARDQGAGVLLVSSELEEVLTLSDRILVFFEGAIVAEFSRAEADECAIGLSMGGAESELKTEVKRK